MRGIVLCTEQILTASQANEEDNDDEDDGRKPRRRIQISAPTDGLGGMNIQMTTRATFPGRFPHAGSSGESATGHQRWSAAL